MKTFQEIKKKLLHRYCINWIKLIVLHNTDSKLSIKHKRDGQYEKCNLNVFNADFCAAWLINVNLFEDIACKS